MLAPHSDPGGRFVRAQETALSMSIPTDPFQLGCHLVGGSLWLWLATGHDLVNKKPRRYMFPFSSHTLHMAESPYSGSSAYKSISGPAIMIVLTLGGGGIPLALITGSCYSSSFLADPRPLAPWRF